MTITLPRGLVQASGGPRYTVAVAVDALGTGMLRPFLLLYGIKVVGLSATTTGIAMTAGIVTGLACTPAVGRWLDRGARSDAVAAAMLVRILGVLLLLATPGGNPGMFAAAALFLGIGNQAWPAAHAALIATVSTGRTRDAALAAARSVRNAGMGIGALVAAACLAGGTTALKGLAAATAVGYATAAVLAWSVHVSAAPPARPSSAAPAAPAPSMRAVLLANVVFAFCLNVPEVALPLVLATQVHASPVWSAGVLVLNTVLVVALQVGVTVRMSRFPRHITLMAAGIILTLSYLGFLLATPLHHGLAAPVITAVSALCTFGEVLYAGSATALVAATAPPQALGRALARLQLSSGLGLAISPAVMTTLAAHGSATLWGSLALATLAAAAAAGRHGRPPRRRSVPAAAGRATVRPRRTATPG
ncbi:MFS transporter [Streptomyces sp. NBC_01198]|uniref:MFS transporter n=1 Tax=Streptomyces sp. NBC_01198 TaxID=2903769 RepID=UPI002E0E82AF|nr:MFS transporter [Streptomyces sp. NBC_01198]